MFTIAALCFESQSGQLLNAESKIIILHVQMKISENEHLLAYSIYNSMHDFKNKSIIMTLSISKVSCGEWNLNRNFPALFKCKGCRKRGVYLLVFRQRNTRNKILLSSTGQRSSNHFLVSVGDFSFSTKNA